MIELELNSLLALLGVAGIFFIAAAACRIGWDTAGLFTKKAQTKTFVHIGGR